MKTARGTCALVIAGSIAALSAGCGGGKIAGKIAEEAATKGAVKQLVKNQAALARASERATENELRASGRALEQASPVREGPTMVAADEATAATYVEGRAPALGGAETTVAETASITATYVNVAYADTANRCAGGAMRGAARAITQSAVTRSEVDITKTYDAMLVGCLTSAFPEQQQQIKVVAALYHAGVVDGLRTWVSELGGTLPSNEEFALWLVYTASETDPSGYTTVLAA